MFGAITRMQQRRKAYRERVRADADVIITEHGRLAYSVARQMALAERSGRLISPGAPLDHWDRVRREVRRVAGRL